jgi:hypothetical protein
VIDFDTEKGGVEVGVAELLRMSRTVRVEKREKQVEVDDGIVIARELYRFISLLTVIRPDIEIV